VKKTYRLFDVVLRKAYRLFDQRNICSVSQDQPSVCGAIAIHQQPTGELIPGTAVFLVRDSRSEEGEDEGVMRCEHCGKLMIVIDEFIGLMS
jgi:hypothetical protein